MYALALLLEISFLRNEIANQPRSQQLYEMKEQSRQGLKKKEAKAICVYYLPLSTSPETLLVIPANCGSFRFGSISDVSFLSLASDRIFISLTVFFSFAIFSAELFV